LIAWVKGLLRPVGLSNATAAQIGEAHVRIVCVQSVSSVAHRADDALIDDLAREGRRLAPFFPLGV
jgi:aryl-alcohol dehydrogenase-like predicted oxidoreductase